MLTSIPLLTEGHLLLSDKLLAIDTTMQVYEELHTQAEAARRLRAQQVERARYAAELAQRRFLRVDPENRLVADVLEADWNARLRELACVQEEAERKMRRNNANCLPWNSRRLPTWWTISRGCGRIPAPLIGTANAWSACCWKM